MLVYGKNVVKETLEKNINIKKAYIYDGFNDEKILSMLKKRNISIKFLTKNELNKIDNGNNQGIIIDIPDFVYSDLDDLLISEKPFIVILDHIEDPHNFGAIIRTCESAGVDGIIIPKDRSVSINSTVMKTSAGALNNVKICKVTNLSRTIDELKNRGLWIFGTNVSNSISYNSVDYDIPLALVIGSEGFGISKLINDKCDYIINIPMKGKVNSLNASVAAGILIYKIIEKRNW